MPPASASRPTRPTTGNEVAVRGSPARVVCPAAPVDGDAGAPFRPLVPTDSFDAVREVRDRVPAAAAGRRSRLGTVDVRSCVLGDACSSAAAGTRSSTVALLRASVASGSAVKTVAVPPLVASLSVAGTG